jgi:hypothetical protein
MNLLGKLKNWTLKNSKRIWQSTMQPMQTSLNYKMLTKRELKLKKLQEDKKSLLERLEIRLTQFSKKDTE